MPPASSEGGGRGRRRTRVPRTHNRLAFRCEDIVVRRRKNMRMVDEYLQRTINDAMLTRRVHNAAAHVYSPSLAMPAMAVDVVVVVVVVTLLSSSIKDTGRLEALTAPAAKMGEEATSAVRALWRRMMQEERKNGEERAMPRGNSTKVVSGLACRCGAVANLSKQ